MKWIAAIILIIFVGFGITTSCGDDATRVVISKWLNYPTHVTLLDPVTSVDTTFVLEIATGDDLGDYHKYAEDYWVNRVTYSLEIDQDSSSASVSKLTILVSYLDGQSKLPLLTLNEIPYVNRIDQPVVLPSSALDQLSVLVGRDGVLTLHLSGQVDASPAVFTITLSFDMSVQANFDSAI